MFTSSYAKSARHPDSIGISLGVAKWYNGPVYGRLAPKGWMLKLPPRTFDRKYRELLESLNPFDVVNDLGENAVLLCWEAPNVYCHRRIVAEWLEERVGMVIPELGMHRAQSLTVAQMLDAAVQTDPSSQLSLL